MRLILLEICAAMAALLFVAVIAAIAGHRGKRRSEGGLHQPLSEYAWAVVPWLLMVGSAFPAVSLTFAGS